MDQVHGENEHLQPRSKARDGQKFKAMMIRCVVRARVLIKVMIKIKVMMIKVMIKIKVMTKAMLIRCVVHDREVGQGC